MDTDHIDTLREFQLKTAILFWRSVHEEDTRIIESLRMELLKIRIYFFLRSVVFLIVCVALMISLMKG